MSFVRSLAGLIVAAATVGCAHQAVESEAQLRSRLQAEHDATLLLELRGQLDPSRARDIESVACWWYSDTWLTHEVSVVPGAVNSGGVVRMAVPAFDILRPTAPFLHFVDRAGAHWYCAIDRAAPPPPGVFDLGLLQLTREPEAPTVVDERGRPIAGARVQLDLLGKNPHYFEAETDGNGRVQLCRALPIDTPVRLIVRHDDYAPWWGDLTDRVELSHGAELRGRVVLPTTLDSKDVVAHLWVSEAEAPSNDFLYAAVKAPIGRDGSYCLRNVPFGKHDLWPAGRRTSTRLGPKVKVDVVATESTAPDLTVYEYARTTTAMRIRLVDERDQPVRGDEVTILVSDVGARLPLRDGYFDWEGDPTTPFGIEVDGYVEDPRRVHRTGETICLRGGHRVSVRLALECARRLPPGCALSVRVDGPRMSTFKRWERVSLRIDRDAEFLVACPGSYRIGLELARWDITGWYRNDIRVDVAPSEFEVRADDDVTLVTVASPFTEAGR